MSAQKWWFDPIDVHARLAEIGGLTVEVLHTAGIQGEIARAAATENHPRLTGPFNAYCDATASLRDQLGSLGWTKLEEKNYPLTVSPDGAHAIVVAAGDECTGSKIAPKTKSPKGPRTFAAVAANAQQISLFDLVEQLTPPTAAGDESQRLTWVLLVHRTIDGDDAELRMELSLPSRIGEDGRIEHWPERIILPVIRLDGDPGGLRAVDPGPDIDVDVTRRLA